MKKNFIVVLACLLPLLAACQAKTTTPSGTSTLLTAPTATSGQAPASAPGCTVVTADPTPGATEESLFPPVSDEDWIVGPETAEVTIFEYSDFQ
ncbi:MAG: hypothetical protein PHS96_09480 [Anaerolineales bacterium]|nr:hypothetical protein [Anaerolineales bacterium]